ncbi:hypothetical protein FOZ63_026647 [Perkinsus olseni]|uniref:Peptidase A1 domain-containing protein n=1 Tax=Perkinsus olseni TaxID=32597 RepID=A0A7J6TH70_PEROL|nr:hypothetical protein FOZ62_023247 [Perkinsus olseni]KAF4744861.1 hypothetical protein FOZ63_026647 [Perkinsus olseni]
MLVISIFSAAAHVALLAASVHGEPIALPLTKSYVPLKLDNQTVNLIVDSGSTASFAIYGPWYEGLHGVGSCSNLTTGCYFCPKHNPCEDIFSRGRRRVRFSGGEVFRYVQHRVTLGLGENKTALDFGFGLVIGYNNTSGKTDKVLGNLGLSVGLRGLPETFLEQLKERGVISELSYSIRTNGRGRFISGTLTLGDSRPRSAPYVSFSRHPEYFGETIAVPLWPLRLFDYLGNLSILRTSTGDTIPRHAPVPSLLDSGALSLRISSMEFEMIVKATTTSMHRRGIKTDEPIREDPIRSVSLVKEEAVPYLPTLAFDIGEAPHMVDIRIKPEHYIHSCRSGTCVMDLRRQRNKTAVTGRPLFRAYDVKFDLQNSRIYFWPHEGSSGHTAGASQPLR